MKLHNDSNVFEIMLSNGALLEISETMHVNSKTGDTNCVGICINAKDFQPEFNGYLDEICDITFDKERPSLVFRGESNLIEKG